MLGHFGFSYVGLIYLCMLFVPNILWAKKKPAGYDELAADENKILLMLERLGEVLVTTMAVIFSDFNLREPSLWSIWLLLSFLLMLLYEIWWVRYFRNGRTLEDFYGSYFGVPVPGALLPVLAFFLLGIYGKVIWLLIEVIILGIGHVGIHLQHRKEVKVKKNGE